MSEDNSGVKSHRPSVVRCQGRAFLAAVAFLTRLPVLSPEGPAEVALEDLRRGVVYFPLVGGLVGLTTAGVVIGAQQLWAPWPAVLLGLAWEAWLTGAFHEDAVADFCDAFGGGWTAEDVLRILKDSRIGTYGALGLMLAVLLRGSAMSALMPLELLIGTVAAAAWGRLVMVALMVLLPPVPGRAGLAKDIGHRPGVRTVVLAALPACPALVPLAVFSVVRASVAVVVTAGFLAALVPYLRRRIGGVTGDCLGFAGYVGQLIVLLVVSARW
jgi:adenosylcobinamide-GDP ribazoletransferase